MVQLKEFVGDIEEEMTILELKLTQVIEDIILDSKGKIEIQGDILIRIRKEMRKNNITFGALLTEGKLFTMQKISDPF